VGETPGSASAGARCPACHRTFRTGYQFCPTDGTSLDVDGRDAFLGSTIGDRYEVERLLGVGGFGRVYQVRHVRMSRRFALKLLRDDAAADEKARRRFVREAEAIAHLSHPNVVGVLDVGETEGGTPYLVMELAAGESMAAIVERETPFSRARVLRLFRQILEGLAHAHDQGVVHRDVKPENVLVERAGTEREHARLIDFGLALEPGQASSDRLTTVGMMVGTPAYLSPEQATGDEVDARSDLYSVGVCLYEAMSGMLPFHGTPIELAQQHARVTPSRLAGLHVDRQLEAIAFWLMEKRPADRPHTAHDVIAVLTLLEDDPDAAPALLQKWLAPSGLTSSVRAMWRPLDYATTARVDPPDASYRTPTLADSPSATAGRFSNTVRHWPPTIDQGMNTRRIKLAAGSAPPDAWGRVGTVVNGHLRFRRLIGSGPHGTVYEAVDLRDGRAVAVKVLHHRNDVAGLQREVELAPMFRHPNLVEIHALGRLDDGSLYLVSDLVPGIDLARLAAEGALSERRALRLLRDALRGLEAAHRASVPHGDLKPENLIVRDIGVPDGDVGEVEEPVRVVDLSLARLFRDGVASKVVAAGGACIAPEVASTRIPSIRGDVYALGVVLADLLGMDADAIDMRRVSPEVGFVLWRATQPDAGDRFRDATEMLRSVEVALRVLR
jgi:serine/threonine protein kinase